MKKKIFVIFVSLVIIAGSSVVYAWQKNSKKNSIVIGGITDSSSKGLIQNEINNVVSNQSESNSDPSNTNVSATIPDSKLINVPFLSQAPFGVWDALHEDACEEASLIMVKHFMDKSGLNPSSGDEEIRKMISYEEKNGYGISISLEQLNQIAKDYYNLNTGRIEKNITVDDIKKELAAGRPVIVGAAGKILPNPNFRNGGPNYHMLVIKGYDNQGFITNDPGTRKGESFRYTSQALFNAIHDWNPNIILNGEKNYLVFD